MSIAILHSLPLSLARNHQQDLMTHCLAERS